MKDKVLATIRGVLFDWDLTLARTVGDVTRNARLVALFQANGFPCTLEAIEQAAMAYQQEINQSLQPVDGYPLQTQAGTIQYYLYLLKFLGYSSVSWEQAARLYHAYARLPTILYDDTLPTLRKLKGKGLQIGIISNHTPHARKGMEDLVGSFMKPNHIIISEEIGLHKPSGAIFQQALLQMQLPSSQCIFVGDNLQVDAVGAVQQGGFYRGLWLDRSQNAEPPVLPQEVARITSLLQVTDYLSG